MHERKLNRFRGYDYSTPGAYFVTICVKGRKSVFGDILNDIMQINRNGEIVTNCWHDLLNHYHNIKLDQFVIMPNHVHGIIHIIDNPGNIVGNGLKPFPTGIPAIKHHGLPEIIRGFKTFSSRRINELKPEKRFQWQKSYHDRIIRDKEELNRIVQ